MAGGGVMTTENKIHGTRCSVDIIRGKADFEFGEIDIK
jgi:hypothetical protein